MEQQVRYLGTPPAYSQILFCNLKPFLSFRERNRSLSFQTQFQFNFTVLPTCTAKRNIREQLQKAITAEGDLRSARSRYRSGWCLSTMMGLSMTCACTCTLSHTLSICFSFSILHCGVCIVFLRKHHRRTLASALTLSLQQD